MFLFKILPFFLLAVLSSCHASILKNRDNRNNVYEMVMSKARDLERSILKDAESMVTLEEDLEDSNMNNVYNIPVDMEDSKACSCDRSSGCECCQKVPLLKDTVCEKMTYLRDELGIQLKVTYNGKTVIEKKIPVNDPKPFCVAGACFTFYNLSATGKDIKGCLKIDFKKITMEVGCFTIPFPGKDDVTDSQMMIRADKHPSAKEDVGVSTINNVDESNIAEVDIGVSKACSCQSSGCSCCQDINLKVIKGTVCEQFTYLPDKLGIKLAVTFNGKAFITKDISVNVKDPPPICAKIKVVKACIAFYNVEATAKELKGCSKLEIKSVIKKTFELGCFHISLLDENDSTGLPFHNSHGDVFMMMIKSLMVKRENK